MGCVILYSDMANRLEPVDPLSDLPEQHHLSIRHRRAHLKFTTPLWLDSRNSNVSTVLVVVVNSDLIGSLSPTA